MSKKTVLSALTISVMIILLTVAPVTARAITYTEVFSDEVDVFEDVTICDQIRAMVTVNYDGVLHITEYSGGSPVSGTAHARLKINFDVVVNDYYTGELLEEAHGVKTLFHDNINNQNATSRFNFISVGSGPVGSHQFLLNGHVTWNANGNPVDFASVNVHCW